ncbi:EpsG family protein [Treponema pedis]|nr:EpsG family protein [Treponema pedis]QSI03591.1 EpsG family protein [Treponema pedis]
MPIYVLILFFFVSAFLSCNRKYFTELSYFMILMSLLIFPILIGINSDRADFGNYLLFFQNSPVSIFSVDFFEYAREQHAELGYNYFQAVIKFFVNSATFFFIIFCFISLFIRYRHYRYFISLSDLAIVLFAFFAHEFIRKDAVQIRNGMASSIILFSLIFLFQNKRIKFLFLVFLASSFHMVALAALPLFFVKSHKIFRHNSFLLYIFVFSLIASVFFPVRKVLSMVSFVLPADVNAYLNWTDYLVPMSFTNPILLKQIIITIYVFLKRKKLFGNTFIYFLFRVYLLSTCYYLVFRDFEIISARLGSLFYAVEVPLLILIINHSNRNTIIKKSLLCLFYFMFLLINIFTYKFLGFEINIY